MRSTLVVLLVVWAGLGLGSIGAAQTLAGPAIRNVTLPDGTETQIEVVAPAALLTTPGTYRLTLVDPVRQVGDAFVVASRAGVVVPGDGAPRATPVPVIGAVTAAGGPPAAGAVVTGVPRSSNGPAPMSIEEAGPPYRTALGYQALFNNTSTGQYNTASGYLALVNNTSGQFNAALGVNAGGNATTGSYNLFLGADVTGTAADTNTIRIGLPYGGTRGQNKTFIAGIHGTTLTEPAVQVFVDANGQLGTLTPGVVTGTVTIGPLSKLQQQVLDQQRELREQQQQLRDQQTVNANLRARLARLEALLAPAARQR